MPEFLEQYAKKIESIQARKNQQKKWLELELEKKFNDFWINKPHPKALPSEFNVAAVDSSSYYITTADGGIFYVARAIARAGESTYRKLDADVEYTSEPEPKIVEFVGRKMEWLEHEVALEVAKEKLAEYILIDGSIYGRLAHLPLELHYANNKDFMLEYFETLAKLLETCEKNRIAVIGISKESRTSFFREFLIRVIACNLKEKIGLSIDKIQEILTLALDNKRKALEESEKVGNELLRDLIEELISRKPDFQLILKYARNEGYTTPLLIGASARWRRSYKRIKINPEEFVKSNFPFLSRNEEFVESALKIVRKMEKFPSIVSFHLLPAINDTPIRVDVPSWVFGIEKKLAEIGWPEETKVDIDKILKLISAGYCGLENYNIWLKAVDEEVKLRKSTFENLYLPKFEEFFGKFATSRSYRRIRFP